MEFQDTDITIQDLREIIRGLRIANFPYVEQDALTEVTLMIKSLPSSEQLNGVYGNKDAIKKIQDDIGKIMRFIELYGKRDPEYKVRYKSRTGLPPRYNVLEWRSAMKEIRNDIVKELVTLSQEADDVGLTKIAVDLLGIAKGFKEEKLPVKELWAATQSFYKEAIDNGKMIKEAQAFTDIQVDLTDIRKGLGQINAWFSNIQNAFTTKLQYLQQNPKTQKYMQVLGNIWKQVSQLQQNTSTQIQQIDQASTQMEQQMDRELTPQSINIGGKNYNISYMADPTDPAYEMATVNVNGKQYEVQEDESGKRSLKLMGTQTATQPQTQPTTPETAASGTNTTPIYYRLKQMLTDKGVQVGTGRQQPNLNQLIDLARKNLTPQELSAQNINLDALPKAAFNLKKYLISSKNPV